MVWYKDHHTFPRNPGYLNQLKFQTYLDGNRRSIATDESAKARLFVYPNGFHGENYEYFSEECSGVFVTLLKEDGDPNDGDYNIKTYYYLGGLTPVETRKLQKCLGEADDDEDTVSETGSVGGVSYDWDYGSIYYPHMIRLVDQTLNPVTDLCDGHLDSTREGAVRCTYNERFDFSDDDDIHPLSAGFIVPLIYDPVDKRFKIFTKPGIYFSPTTQFAVFTTTGTATLSSNDVNVYTQEENPYSQMVYTKNITNTFEGYKGNLDCETNPSNINGVIECVEKGDIVFLIDNTFSKDAIVTNTAFLNFYFVKRIFREAVLTVPEDTRYKIMLDKSINAQWLDNGNTSAKVYIFTPPEGTQQGYRYVSECSNRGNCDRDTGLCECFTGYTGDACQVIDSTVDV